MFNNIVIVKKNVYTYPQNDSFRPSIDYPEYPFDEINKVENNYVYDMVREGFRMMGYDKENYGTEHWNPLGKIISPGSRVVIKPNLVIDVNLFGKGTDCLYTNPAVVAAVIDYVCIALKGKGEIIIGDAPIQECNFENLIEKSGYKSLKEYYLSKDIKIQLIDFRELKTVNRNGIYYQEITPNTPGVIVDLKKDSEFDELPIKVLEKLRITNYDPTLLKDHHKNGKHEYYISKAVLSADVFINMPKPKTHRKAGVTIALKNVIGINCRKEFLPHHTNGSKSEGGDGYLKKSKLKSIKDYLLDKKNIAMQREKNYIKTRILNYVVAGIDIVNKRILKDTYYEGSWYGNTTISKTIADLNKILFYADINGNMDILHRKKMLIVADMIVSGEKEGPIYPEPKNLGIIAIGENPVIFDEIISKLMGMKEDYFSTVKVAKKIKGKYKLIEEGMCAKIISNSIHLNEKTMDEIDEDDIWYFNPSSGWIPAFECKKER